LKALESAAKNVKAKILPMGKLTADNLKTVTSPKRVAALFRVSLYGNAMYLMAGSVSNAIFGLVFWVLVARLYSTEAVGLASAIISAANLIAMASGLGLGHGLVKFLHSSEYPSRLINTTFTVAGLSSLGAALIFVLGIGIWSPALSVVRNNAIYFSMFALCVPIASFSALIDQCFVAGLHAGYSLVRNLIINILRLALPALLVGSFHSFGIFGSWGGALGVALLVVVFLLPRAWPGYRPALDIDRDMLAKTVRFSLPNYLSDLFWTAPTFVIPILLVNVLGAGDSAYFYISWAISGIVTMIPGAISNSLFAEGASDGSRLGQNLVRSLKMVFALLTPAVIVVEILAPRLLLAFGNLYTDKASSLLRLLAVAAFPVAINMIYFAMQRVQNKLKTVVCLTAIAGVITVGLSKVVLPTMGITGVGVAWLTSQSIVAGVVVVGWLRERSKR
jgi:O-antigen/teichoic acid export membrane protein